MTDTSAHGEQKGRWIQLFIGIICMVMIANLQYGWNLFVEPMSKAQGWSRVGIGGAFSFFVLAETWLVPVESWFSGPLLPHARTRLLDGLAPWDLIRQDYLERLLDGRLGGLRPRRGVKIWMLITLESWLRGVLRG